MLPSSELAPSATLDIDSESFERALGVLWETTQDVLTFSSTLQEGLATKQGIMGTMCSLFGPLGFLAPFVLQPKLLLQQLWILGLDWDESVSDDVMKLWKSWVAAVKRVTKVKLHRCYVSADQSIDEIQLHMSGFSL